MSLRRDDIYAEGIAEDNKLKADRQEKLAKKKQQDKAKTEAALSKLSEEDKRVLGLK